jgi:diguanylate cyclase (GGDEF)-like protein
LSLRDELTGLYNRRGLGEHGAQLLRAAARSKRAACVFFIDLNDMKVVNDTLGHDAGDRALLATAQVLLGTFRDADIVARVGGDEFAVFAAECCREDVAPLRQRLRERTAEFNARKLEPFHLSMSVGAELFEPGTTPDLDALIEAADQDMYKEKRATKKAAKEEGARRHAERRSKPPPAAAPTRN